MSTKTTQRDPIKAAKRKSVAERRVGIGKACACGENRPFALIAGSEPMTCQECLRRKQGRNVYDNHHVAGKNNHPLTIPVRANDHKAILSEAQHDWPQQTLRNPDGSPLLAIAARIRGLIDMVRYLLEKLAYSIPEYLERLNASLTERFGPQWWTQLGFELAAVQDE